MTPAEETPLEFCALASGSKGNAVYVGLGGRGVLIDAGLHGRDIESRFEAVGLEASAVDAVVVTHEHRDHISGAGVWARRFRVPVFAARATWEAARSVLPPRGLTGFEAISFEPGQSFEAAGLRFHSFRTKHDAEGSVGFRIEAGSRVVGFATDLGSACAAVRASLSVADLLYLESNHDEARLAAGPYPAFLKRRIRSTVGHLSNEESSALLTEVLHGGLRAVVLGHLSEVNNTPRLAWASACGALERAGAAADVTLLVARQDRPGTVLRLPE